MLRGRVGCLRRPTLPLSPGVNSASKKWVPGIPLGVKAAGTWGWRPTTLVMPNVKKSGALIYPNPLGPSRRPVVGETFIFTFTIKGMGISLSSHRLTEFFVLHSIHKIHKYLCCSLATPYYLFWCLKWLYNSWCSFDKSPCLIFHEKTAWGIQMLLFTFLGYDRNAPPSLSFSFNPFLLSSFYN